MKLQTKKFTKSLIFSAIALSLSACELVDSGDDDEIVNASPVITSTGVLSIEAGTAYTYTLVANDPDGDPLTLDASSIPSWLSFDATSGVLSGTPTESDEGSHSITLSVSDGTIDTIQSFSINVTVPEVNNTPVISSVATVSATEGTEYSYTLMATDADGDDLIMVGTTVPSWLAFDAATGVLSGTPALADVGSHNVVLTVDDAQSTVTDSFTIAVEPLPVDQTPTSGALTIFADSVQTGWFAWDDSGQYPPVVVTDENADQGQAVEFKTTGNTVAGFTTRTAHGATNGIIHDASTISTDGTLSFDLKMTQTPTAGTVAWFVKVEGTDGDAVSAVELNLSTSQEGHSEPVLDTWQTYTFNLKTLAERGLNMEKIDLVMVFPQWGQGDGAMYLLDNMQFNVDGSDYVDDTGNSGDQLIANGTFDTNSGWGGTDGMADSIADGVFTANVGAAGNPWDVSLKYGLSLMPNTTYELKFDARSDDSRDIIAGIGLDNAPWDNDTETVSLSSEMTTYTLTLSTENYGGNTDRVFFDMGASVGHVVLDNVSLMAVEESTGGETGGGDGSAYCSTEVFHFGNTAQTDSMALLTIESLDANTLEMTLASDDDDPIDVLIINGALGGVRGDQDTSVAGQISQTLSWDTAPENVVFNILWSHGSFDGNWQLSEGDTTVPFSAKCGEDADGGGDNGSGATMPLEAAATPTVAADGVISVFSDTYTDIDGVNVNPDWGQATATSIVDIAGNNTIKMANLNYQGIEFTETDLSAKATLNIDYWTADASTFDVYLISPGPLEKAYNVTATKDGWQTLSIPLSEYSSVVDLTKVFQFKFVATDGPTIYFDNIYFSGTADNSGGNNSGGNTDTGGELVTTGSFDATTGWGGTDGMVASIADGIFSANVAAAGNPWDVSLKYSLSLQPNTTYTLSFDARSDDARVIVAGIGLDNAPWDNVNEEVTLTTDWATYTYTMTTGNFGGNTDRIFFDMGAATGQVQLDNVSLQVVTD